MSFAVYKYPLGFPGPWSYSVTRDLPITGRPLSDGMQGHELMLWALVDPALPSTPRHFLINGTGVDLSELLQSGSAFIGTVRHEGPDQRVYWWHVFELVSFGPVLKEA